MSGRVPGRPRFVVLEEGEVAALQVQPDDARAMLALAHGAGAGIDHPFMSGLAQRLAAHRVATLRYHFPYMEARAREGGRRPPDRAPVLVATVRAAVAEARRLAGAIPLVAGGKSMGGRMTSQAQAEASLEGVAGLVFFGFPLHPAGRPSTERADHLSEVGLPMLFLQGTRDGLAPLATLGPIVEKLGARASLHVVEGADHGFHVLVRSGRTDEEVIDELARTVARWLDGIL